MYPLISTEYFQDNRVRIFGENANPLFAAEDIALILDIRDIRKSISRIEDYLKVTTIIGNRPVVLVYKMGFYTLCHNSKKPIADSFVNWVFEDIAPKIYRGYNEISEMEMQKKTIELLQRQIELHKRTEELLYQQIELLNGRR